MIPSDLNALYTDGLLEKIAKAIDTFQGEINITTNSIIQRFYVIPIRRVIRDHRFDLQPIPNNL